MDEKDLKIQALLERMAEMVVDHENKVAELRVALTLSERRQTTQSRDQQPDDSVKTDYPE